VTRRIGKTKNKASCDRLDITLDAVNQELARLAFVDAGQFMTIDSNGNVALTSRKHRRPRPGNGLLIVSRVASPHEYKLATIPANSSKLLIPRLTSTLNQ
jgi:hypothetical protein